MSDIKFEFDAEKFASAAVYLANRVPGATKKVICKLLFFADQKHLLQFGRTITGDVYHALPQGPVPTQGLDMLNQKRHSPLENLAVMKKYGYLERNKLIAISPPEMSKFSKSDIRVLDAVIADLGSFDHERLEKLSHEELAWKNTLHAKPMDFDLFFEGHPEFNEMRRIVNAEYSKETVDAC